MKTIVDLQGQIDKTTRKIEMSHRKALIKVKKLKEKINELERIINEKEYGVVDLNKLNSATNERNNFTDSLILKSKKLWEAYRKLEHDCQMHAFESSALEALKILGEKCESLAADLLCYSLDHFRKGQ